jgi:hypothetical protein
MTRGPGKYDELCTYVREQANASAAMVIVLGGDKGPGFSVQADPVWLLALPDMLEAMARDIRADMRKAGGSA